MTDSKVEVGKPADFGITSTNAGTVLDAQYVTRRPTLWGVFEHEMDNLSLWNTASTALVGVGSFAASFALTLWIEAAVNNTPTPAASALFTAGVPLGVILAVVSFGLATWFTFKRGGTLTRIKNESQVRTELVQRTDANDR